MCYEYHCARVMPELYFVFTRYNPITSIKAQAQEKGKNLISVLVFALVPMPASGEFPQ